MTESIDLFTLERGIICGMVSVSVQPSSLHPFIAFLNGLMAGVLYLHCLRKTKAAKVDDPLHICIVHGASAVLSLFTICFFHNDEGFLFKDIYTAYNRNDNLKTIEEVDIKTVPPILMVMGSNAVSGFIITFLCVAITFVCLKPLQKMFPRISYTHEIFGLDIHSIYCQSDRILKNYMNGLANEFYSQFSKHSSTTKAQIKQASSKSVLR